MLARLKEIILEKSFLYAVEPTFELAHAGKSKFYFNCKPTMLDPEGKKLIGLLVFDAIKDLDVTAVGGLELGSVPISGAVSLTSVYQGKPIKEFIVRKEVKGRGVPTKIEGELRAGERVVVVDDVITTGTSTIKAIEAVTEIGAIVEKVIILVDREEFDGRENIQKYCQNVQPLIKGSEIITLYKEQEQMHKAATG